MDIKDEGNTVAQAECKFLVRETIQNIVHKFCQNPEILANNKCESGKKLVCSDALRCHYRNCA